MGAARPGAVVIPLQAWVVREPSPPGLRRLHLEERAWPEPGPGQVRLLVRACGICRTDLHIADGELPAARLPIIPGHQVVGTVEALGPGAGALLPQGVVPGGRAGLPWLYEACGRCFSCLRGEENLCEAPHFTGCHVDGGFSQAVVAPAGSLVALPSRYSDVEAAPLLCAGIIGYRSLKVARVRPGWRVALFGFGASAHLALQVAVAWGCEVAVYSRQERHRELARRLGAAWAGEMGQEPPFLADAAVTFAPAGTVAVEALQVVRRGGTVAINAVHMDGLPAFDYGLLYWERKLTSVANATRRDAREFMELAGRLPITVCAEEVPFAEADQALDRLRRSASEGALVLRVRSEA